MRCRPSTGKQTSGKYRGGRLSGRPLLLPDFVERTSCLHPKRENRAHHEQLHEIVTRIDEPKLPWLSVPQHDSDSDLCNEPEPIPESCRKARGYTRRIEVRTRKDKGVCEHVRHRERPDKTYRIGRPRLFLHFSHFLGCHHAPSHEFRPDFAEQRSIPQKTEDHRGNGGGKYRQIIDINHIYMCYLKFTHCSLTACLLH